MSRIKIQSDSKTHELWVSSLMTVGRRWMYNDQMIGCDKTSHHHKLLPKSLSVITKHWQSTCGWISQVFVNIKYCWLECIYTYKYHQSLIYSSTLSGVWPIYLWMSFYSLQGQGRVQGKVWWSLLHNSVRINILLNPLQATHIALSSRNINGFQLASPIHRDDKRRQKLFPFDTISI